MESVPRSSAQFLHLTDEGSAAAGTCTQDTTLSSCDVDVSFQIQAYHMHEVKLYIDTPVPQCNADNDKKATIRKLDQKLL